MFNTTTISRVVGSFIETRIERTDKKELYIGPSRGELVRKSIAFRRDDSKGWRACC